MDQYGLTAKQLKLFKFIKNYIAKKNISPSYEEMKMAVGLKSKNSIKTINMKIHELKTII